MNKIIVAAAGLLAGLVCAQSTELRDVWYAPPAGKFNGESTAVSSYERTTAAGASESDLSTFVLGQAFRYGVTNRLSLALSGAYAWSKTKDGPSASGLKNPSVEANYRRLVSAPNNLYFRGILEVNPALAQSTEHNEFEGNTLVGVTGLIGQQIGKWEYSAGINLDYFTATRQEGGDLDSRFDWTLKTAAQYDFTKLWSLDFQLEFGLPGTLREKDTDQKTKFDYLLTTSAGPDFQFTKNLRLQILAELNFARGTNATDAPFSRLSYGNTTRLTYNF